MEHLTKISIWISLILILSTFHFSRNISLNFRFNFYFDFIGGVEGFPTNNEIQSQIPSQNSYYMRPYYYYPQPHYYHHPTFWYPPKMPSPPLPRTPQMLQVPQVPKMSQPLTQPPQHTQSTSHISPTTHLPLPYTHARCHRQVAERQDDHPYNKRGACTGVW